MARIIAKKIRAFFLELVWRTRVNRRKTNSDKRIVFAECYIEGCDSKAVGKNWGDDLNKFLFAEMNPDIDILFAPVSKMSVHRFNPCYSLIGSILTFYNLDGKYIYGSGILNPDAKITGKPAGVYSVRGPLTRKVLLENGIDCPEMYGDPALLLPMYVPKAPKTGKRIVIPNMGTSIDGDNAAIKVLIEKLGFTLLSMTEYDNWKDIAGEISGSEMVVSESLHGLIVAEAYGIPNVWVEFKEHPAWWDFKYLDYYLSIGKEEQTSIRLYDDWNADEIFRRKDEWVQGHINLKSLLEVCPFIS